MIRLFHTADWHLGQSFLGFARDDEHRRFLDWLRKQLIEQQPDALLIAGDIFDTINPSAAAQRLYYDFLADAHAAQPDLQIVVIAGNHDAGARLEAPSDLLDVLNISVVGTVRRDDQGEVDVDRFLVPLARDGRVQAIAMAVPFLRPSDVPAVFDGSDPYLDGIRELYRQTAAAAARLRDSQYPNAAIVAMGHCHIHGGQATTDSERMLVVGGAEALRTDTFELGIAYVALGHLHRAQTFEDERLYYSGSPIPLSFAEVNYEHQLLNVTLEDGKLLSVSPLLVPRTTALIRVPDEGSLPLDQAVAHLESMPLDDALPSEQYPYLEVRILEEGPDPARRTRIEQAIEDRPLRLASIKTERPATEIGHQAEAKPLDAGSLHEIRPLDVMMDVWERKYDGAPDDAVLKVFQQILHEADAS